MKGVFGDVELDVVTRNYREFGFKERTSDPDNFLTIFEIEEMWSDLINKTNVLYSDYLNKMVADIDQKKLVAKKKESTQKKE